MGGSGILIRFRRRIAKAGIVSWIEKSTAKFLAQHPGLRFYAFGLDCSAAYAQVNLCFNTEEDFQAGLASWCKRSPEYCLDSRFVYGLRYDTGNWAHQSFDTRIVMSGKKLRKLFGDDPETQAEGFMVFCCEALLAFAKTKTYSMIKKTRHFRTICIDHEEDVAAAEVRMIKCVHRFGGL